MTVFFISLYLKIYKNADLGVAGKILGLAHDVGTQLRNKNGLALDFLLFQNFAGLNFIYVHPKKQNFLSERDL